MSVLPSGWLSEWWATARVRDGVTSHSKYVTVWNATAEQHFSYLQFTGHPCRGVRAVGYSTSTTSTRPRGIKCLILIMY